MNVWIIGVYKWMDMWMNEEWMGWISGWMSEWMGWISGWI